MKLAGVSASALRLFKLKKLPQKAHLQACNSLK